MNTSSNANSQSKPRLYYFNVRGRAEICRLLLAIAKIDYEDVRLEPGSEEFVKMKQEGVLPYGQLPIYVDPRLPILLSQTSAIANHLARHYGLIGHNLQEYALIDMIIEGWREVEGVLINKIYRSKDPEHEICALREEVFKMLANQNRLLESVYATNGSPYFVGGQLTLADLHAFNCLDNHIVFLWRLFDQILCTRTFAPNYRTNTGNRRLSLKTSRIDTTFFWASIEYSHQVH